MNHAPLTWQERVRASLVMACSLAALAAVFYVGAFTNFAAPFAPEPGLAVPALVLAEG
jgi:hypothetical protein